VAEPGDGDPPENADLPPTRNHSALPVAYPDDGPLSSAVRRIDMGLGRAEQIVLVALLAGVVLVAAGHALLDRFAEIRIPYKDNLIRSGTFAIAFLGAAFASHQARHLAMDLLSRSVSPRSRLVLRVILGVFVIGVLLIVIRSGLHWIETERTTPVVGDKLFTPVQIAYLVPAGCVLIILHTVLHMVIDVDYLVRGKTPPERMRSAH
jgi:TRAP-type C4-dicarboxylate transport system permease small subunit